MNITQLEARLRSLPANQSAAPAAIQRQAALLAIGRFGPKQSALQAFTRYSPDFLAARIEWLEQNDQLLTGTLSPKYLFTTLGKEAEGLVREFLNLQPPTAAAPPRPRPQPTTEEEPLPNLHTATLAELKAYCKRHKINASRYGELTPEHKRILNQLTKMQRAERREKTTADDHLVPPGETPTAAQPEPPQELCAMAQSPPGRNPAQVAALAQVMTVRDALGALPTFLTDGCLTEFLARLTVYERTAQMIGGQ